jgi:hypothetical protein
VKKLNRAWKEAEHNTYYFYQTEDGRIIGQVHKITHTKIWVAKIDENNLGQYIDVDFAKKALETYYLIQERTLIE